MKCDRCGLQSDVEQAFSTEKRLLRKPKHFCPDCTVKRQIGSFLWSIAILAGLGILVFALNPSSRAVTAALESILILLLMGPLVIVHEVAHAVAASLTGLRVFGIVIGVGKKIWSGKFLGTDWTINLFPLSGITGIGARPVPYARWKLFFVYLAGPASHVVLMFVFLILWLIVPAWVPGQRLFGPLIFANILLAAVSLFPYKAATLAGMQGSDGWQLLHVPFLKDSELTQHHVGYFLGEAVQSYRANDLGRANEWVHKALSLDNNSGIARNILGMIQMARREFASSRETFLQLLGTENAKEPGLRYLLLNNIAYLDALLHDPSLFPEADQFSAEALKHMPWAGAVVGTRGTVLAEMGQLDEGIALLKKSMAMHPEKQGKALNACHIASGELRRGDHEEASKYLATAKVLDPDCFLIAEVEAQMVRTMDDRR